MTDVDHARADAYHLLGACFYPPEPDTLRRDGTCLALAEALEAVDPAAAAPARDLDPALAEVDDVELRVDHAALFVGPFALKAPPYGSVYLEQAGTLVGETTLAAAGCYAATGLTVTLREPADHVAVELEFMAYLAALAADAADRGDRAEADRLADCQRQFLRAHLGAWAPAFCAAIARGASTRFYRTLAVCLARFVDADLRKTSCDRAGQPVA